MDEPRPRLDLLENTISCSIGVLFDEWQKSGEGGYETAVVGIETELRMRDVELRNYISPRRGYGTHWTVVVNSWKGGP